MQLCTEGAKVEPNQFIFDSVENCPIIRNREAHTTASTVFFSRNPVEDSDLCRSIPEGTAVLFSITCPSDENSVDEVKSVFTESGVSESEFSQSAESYFGAVTCFRGCVQNIQLQNDNSRSEMGFIHGNLLVDIAIGASQAGYNITLVNRILLMDTDEYGSRIFMLFRNVKRELQATCNFVYPLSSTSASVHEKGYSPSLGKRQNGKDYFMYRFMLFSDDFQPFSDTKGIAGGFYMLPLNLHLRNRAGAGSVRVLSLTPPGVSSNNVFHVLIPNILRCTTEGIEMKDFFGIEITTFVDILGYIGDYPAVIHTLDVLGQNAGAPCHLCTFRKYSEKGIGESDYKNTTKNHSPNSTFCRDYDRMESIRHDLVRKEDFQYVGLKNRSQTCSSVDAGSSIESPDYLPLHHLSPDLRNARERVPLTENGERVVPAIFDPCRSAVLAPDHLLAGLSQDVLNAALSVFQKMQRLTAEICIQEAFRTHGLETQSHIFNADAIKIHSMSLSSMFNVILVAPFAFKRALFLHQSGTKKETFLVTQRIANMMFQVLIQIVRLSSNRKLKSFAYEKNSNLCAVQLLNYSQCFRSSLPQRTG